MSNRGRLAGWRSRILFAALWLLIAYPPSIIPAAYLVGYGVLPPRLFLIAYSPAGLLVERAGYGESLAFLIGRFADIGADHAR